MAALAVVYRPLADLVPYARNSRTHSEAQVAQIAASIREFGWTNPVLVDGENGIIAGHGRVMAARVLGLDQVPCIELAGMSGAWASLTVRQERALRLDADNRAARATVWRAGTPEQMAAQVLEAKLLLRRLLTDRNIVC